jgi:hypothetical protein
VPPLEDLVERINGAFGKYFEAIGCAGEIRLGTFYIYYFSKQINK